MMIESLTNESIEKRERAKVNIQRYIIELGNERRLRNLS